MDNVPIRFTERAGSMTIRPKKELLLPLVIIAMFVFSNLLFLTPAVTLISNDEIVYQGRTSADSVGEFLEQIGVNARPWDIVSPKLWEPLRNNMQITIKEGLPVKVYADGQETWASIAAGETVRPALSRSGIEVRSQDRIEVLDGDDTDIMIVTRVERIYDLVLKEIEMPVREIITEELPEGERRVIQEGKTGLMQEKWQTTYEDGEKTDAEVVGGEILEVPIEQIVEVGAGKYVMTAGGLMSYSRSLQVVVTAYCNGTPGTGCPIDERGWSACTGPYNNGYTATGVKAVAGDGSLESPHLIAVDPKLIPLGSMLYLDGLGFAKAVDIGGAIKQNRIDLLMPTHQEALNFGRRSVQVYLLKEI